MALAALSLATLAHIPWSVDTVAAQQRDAARATGIDSSCSSLADGHGGQVQGRGAPESVATSFKKKCAERASRAESAPGKAQPQGSERSLAVVALQVDAAWLRNRNEPQVPEADPQRLSTTVITSGVVIWLLQSRFLASLLT